MTDVPVPNFDPLSRHVFSDHSQWCSKRMSTSNEKWISNKLYRNTHGYRVDHFPPREKCFPQKIMSKLFQILQDG